MGRKTRRMRRGRRHDGDGEDKNNEEGRRGGMTRRKGREKEGDEGEADERGTRRRTTTMRTEEVVGAMFYVLTPGRLE